MKQDKKSEKTLWLLKGSRDVPGWGSLETDARSGKTSVIIFDRCDGWALISAEVAPDMYEGMIPESPRDGLYVSENGYPIYIVSGREVLDAKAVVTAIGGKATAMFEEIGDADAVLQRMGFAY